MNVYCIEEFKNQIEKLKKIKEYISIESDIIDYLSNKSCAELATGARLNNSSSIPYIKKRISGSGGYRLYYLLILKDGDAYMLFIHPKTGKHGSSNVTDEAKKDLYKKVLTDIKSENLFSIDTKKFKDKQLVFEKVATQPTQ